MLDRSFARVCAISLFVMALVIVFSPGDALAARRREMGKGGGKWSPNTHPLIDAGRKAVPREYSAARRSGADLVISPNTRTFSITWSPKATGGNKHDAPIVVVINDEESWSFVDFDHWYPIALERGYGLLVVQWWVGDKNYLRDEDLYEVIQHALGEMKADAKNGVLLFGSGLGATRTFALEYIDRKAATPWFDMAMASAGAKPEGDALYDAMTRKQLGDKPLDGSRWITYCGIRETRPGQGGCSAMRSTVDWMTAMGGKLELMLEDPAGREDDFLRNPLYVTQALDLFAPPSGKK